MVLSLVFSGYGLLRINLHLGTAYDLGIFDQAVWRYAHFQAPFITLKGDGYTIWADHFHPVIALWAPLYWIWDSFRVLVMGQAIVVASAAFPVWRFVSRRWSTSGWAKGFVFYALLSWPIVNLINFDVHEVAFAVPLLAWVVDSLDRRAVRPLLVSCALLLLVREDMGVLVFVAGVIWLVWPLRRRRSQLDWLIGAGLALSGLVAFVLITTVVIPHFATSGYQYWDYPILGDSPGSAVRTLVTRPWTVISQLF